jgi:hypothetical protein
LKNISALIFSDTRPMLGGMLPNNLGTFLVDDNSTGGKTPFLSHANHFEFGFSQVPFSFRKTDSDRWFCRYGRASRMPFSFRQECKATARLIRESTKLPIDILFSGGVDSEVALRSFLEAGIPVRVLSLRFNGGLNSHDIDWVERSCARLGVKPTFVDLDLLKFWENDAGAYAERTLCVSPQLLSTMWLADQTDGYVVMGSGENFIVKRVPSSYVSGESRYLRSTWDLFEKEKIAAWYRHFILQGRDAAPGFYQYTPELMLSWFLDPIGLDLWNDRIPGKLNSVSSKLPIYRAHFDVDARPKYTGFEKVQDQDAVFRAALRAKYSSCDHITKTPVPTLVRSMLPMDSATREAEFISEFSNSEWNDSISLSRELPPAELIDGRIYYELFG